MGKPKCCYCEDLIKYPKTLHKDSQGKYWHTRCYKGHQEYLKYKRGEYPSNWYVYDDSEDNEDSDKKLTGNRKNTPAQLRLLRAINDYVAEHNRYPTWLEIKQLLDIRDDNTNALKKLVEHGHIQITFSNPDRYRKYNYAILKPLKTV